MPFPQSFEDLNEHLCKSRQKGNVVPVALAFQADTLTPVSAFLRLNSSGKARAFFLESVEGGDQIARYSFMGIDPVLSLKIKDSKLKIERYHDFGSPLDAVFKRDSASLSNPLDQLKAYLKSYKTVGTDGDFPPFTGGVVGMVGYDCVRFLEDLPEPRTQSPSEILNLLLFKDVVAFDRVKDRVIVMSNIFFEDDITQSAFDSAKARATGIAERLFSVSPQEGTPFAISDQTSASQFQRLPGEKAALGKAAYVDSVQQLKKHIRTGDIFQCVLSDQFQAPFTKNPFEVYRALRSFNPSPYMFYLATGDRVVLGASPEMLVKVHGRTIQTCPIAGTRSRGHTPEEDKKLERDLCASTKEKAEHLMLVDLSRNDIGRVAEPGTVRVDEFMQVHRFSNVMHLVSTVEGKLKKSLSPWDAFFACFPAGTLSGAPKIRAMELIYEHEHTPRGTYGGAIVYSDFSGNFDSCITIRSATFKDDEVTFQAGAGIVADSRPEKEYEEVLHKSNSMRLSMELCR